MSRIKGLYYPGKLERVIDLGGRASIPPSAMHWTAASMKGAAVPYGSRSTTSTRLRSGE
jgi:hypothetical protein